MAMTRNLFELNNQTKGGGVKDKCYESCIKHYIKTLGSVKKQDFWIQWVAEEENLIPLFHFVCQFYSTSLKMESLKNPFKLAFQFPPKNLL